MLIALFVIIGLSLLILGHEAGHFLAAKYFKLKVDEFGFGFPPRIFAWRPKAKKSETEYSVNWLPFGGFVKIAGENAEIKSDTQKLEEISEEEKEQLFVFQSVSRRSLIILAGVTMNFIIGWFLISSVLMIGTPPVLIVSEVQAGSPAEEAGILQGDVIKNYTAADSFIKFVSGNRGKEIEVQVERGKKDLVFKVTPRAEVDPKQGALGVFLAEGGVPRQGFFNAIYTGLKQSVVIVGLTISALYELLKNLILHGSLISGIVGPVGIFGVAQQAGEIGFIYLLQLMSLISLNLAVVNLIPFPALDGGRFLMILIEKIKGSPIPRRVEALVNGLGFAFLIFLMAILTIRDIARWF
ncbi:MAG: RIP metalloprotease RseP [Candidatus Liptonbacteria bacterium]|nr:RIP metalloprotease RseP [Candidatus Liptonbacteria bacterium]